MAAVTRACKWCGTSIKSYDYGGKPHRVRCRSCSGLSVRFRRERKAFDEARRRCSNPEHVNYGARGIEFRFLNFLHFLREVGARPSEDAILDRIDVNGHYECGNVRWVTPKISGCNKRNVELHLIDGVEDSIRGHCKRYGLSLTTVQDRLKAGATLKAAVLHRGPIKRGRGAKADWSTINQNYPPG